MKSLKNQRGFIGHHLIVPIVVIAAVAAIGTYVLKQSNAAQLHKTANFTGTITADACAKAKLPLGSAGCTITVGNKVVTVDQTSPITAAPKPEGGLIGFASVTTDYTGRKVQVYAAIASYVSANIQYTLQGSTLYYVRLLPQNPSDLIPGYIKGFIYLRSSSGNCPALATCPFLITQPYQASVTVKTYGPAVPTTVTTFTSATDGSYSVTLGHGTYLLVPQPNGNGQITAPNQTVTVLQGGITNTNIYYTANTP